jgi:hypothetical protein
MNLIRLSLALILVSTLVACKPQTMDDCLAAAARDAKSVAALELLRGVCEREHAEERVVIKNVGEVDEVGLTPPFAFMFGGVSQIYVTRSSMELSDFGIKAAVLQFTPQTESAEIRPAFDIDGRYSSTPLSQLEFRGIKEFDCKNGRARWLNVDTKLYIGSRGEPVAVLSLPVGTPERQEFDEAQRQWQFIADREKAADFQYVCDGKIDPNSVSAMPWLKNICGKNYASACETKIRFKPTKWKPN